jgi:hypothetical protein
VTDGKCVLVVCWFVFVCVCVGCAGVCVWTAEGSVTDSKCVLVCEGVCGQHSAV